MLAKPILRTRTALLAAAVLLPLIVLSFHSLCHLIFTCGCQPLFLAGVDHCNIHTPGVPHCPFCTGGPVRLYWVGVLTLGPPLLLCASQVRRGAGSFRVIGMGLLGYVAGAAFAGLIAALITGYPTWLGIPLPRLVHG